jgi:Group II intron, maturase-specific domain
MNAGAHNRVQAEQVQARLAAWLEPRGLAFNADETAIRHLDTEGCDFLGFSIRRYRGKLLIKPSAAAMRRIRKRLSTEMRELRGGNATAVIATLNPIIRGWAAYYRTVVSSKAFSALDDHMWRLLYKWASHAHPNKAKYWVTARYFGRFHPSRQDRWVFGDRDSGAYLAKFSWTKIVRHTLVNARVPRQPDADRILGNTAPQKPSPAGPRHAAHAHRPAWPLSTLPKGCSCTPTKNHKTLPSGNSGSKSSARPSTARRSSRTSTPIRTAPSHLASHTPTAARRSGHSTFNLTNHQGLLEPCAVGAARTVLRGRERSSALPLPDTLPKYGRSRHIPGSNQGRNPHFRWSRP